MNFTEKLVPYQPDDSAIGINAMGVNAMPQSGIYAIENTLTGDVYVGSSVNIESRWKQHQSALSKGKHHSQYLQRAYNKYGEAAFVYRILESVAPVRISLIEREQAWIEQTYPVYNMNPLATNNQGRVPSEETKQLLRDYNLRPEVVAKKKAELTGHAVLPETLEKIKEARAKQPITEGMLKSLEIGRSLPFEQRKGMTGKKHSEETLLRMSATAKGRKPSPLAIQNSLETRRLKRLRAQKPLTLWDV